jgi:hypothetical protein
VEVARHPYPEHVCRAVLRFRGVLARPSIGDFLYGVAVTGYVVGVLYVATQPWHDEIRLVLDEMANDIREKLIDPWKRGTFYLEAKRDLMLLPTTNTKG